MFPCGGIGMPSKAIRSLVEVNFVPCAPQSPQGPNAGATAADDGNFLRTLHAKFGWTHNPTIIDLDGMTERQDLKLENTKSTTREADRDSLDSSLLLTVRMAWMAYSLDF